MRMHLSSAAAALLLLASVGAVAAQDVVVTQEQDTVVREYVKKQPLASVKLPGGGGVERRHGSARHGRAPRGPQRQIPLVDNRTVLVDPSTRKIVKVYD